MVHKMGWSITLDEGLVNWFRPRGLRFEPGPASPDPPLDPPKRPPSLAEAAGYSRIFDFLGYLAQRPIPNAN